MKKILSLIIAAALGLLAVYLVWQQTAKEPGGQLSPDALAARAIIQKYCEAEFQGATLSTDNYLKSGIDSFIVPGEREPYGFDTATVVAKYQITAIEVEAEKALVKVKFTALGELTPNAFNLKKEVEEYSYKLIKKDGDWKLIDPYDFQPHISIDTAIKHLQSAADEQKEDQPKIQEIIRKLRELKGLET